MSKTYNYIFFDASTIDGKSMKRYSSYDELILEQTFTYSQKGKYLEESYKLTDNFFDEAKEMPMELFALSEEVENVILMSLSFEEVKKGKFDYNFVIFSQNKKNRDANKLGKVFQIQQSHLEPQKNNLIESIIHDLETMELAKEQIVESIKNNVSIQTKYDEQVIYSNFVAKVNNKFIEIFGNLLADLLEGKQFAGIKLMPQPIGTPTRLEIEYTNHLKGEQYKKTFKTPPNEKGIVFEEITQDIHQNHQTVKTVNGNLQLKYTPAQLQDSDVLLFDINSKGISRIDFALNAHDARVFKAVCSLIFAFKRQRPDKYQEWINHKYAFIVTPQQIYTAMGYPSAHPSKTQKEDIELSMRKMSACSIYYDWSEEREARHIDLEEAIESFGADAVMLSENEAVDVYGTHYKYRLKSQYVLRNLQVELEKPNGKINPKTGRRETIDAYKIEAVPPLYAHAMLTGKFVTIPLSRYKVEKFPRLTPKRNALITGLAERIETLYYYQGKSYEKKSHYNLINVDNLILECGIRCNNSKDRTLITDDIETILRDFIDNQKILQDFKIRRNGRRIESYELIPIKKSN